MCRRPGLEKRLECSRTLFCFYKTTWVCIMISFVLNLVYKLLILYGSPVLPIKFDWSNITFTLAHNWHIFFYVPVTCRINSWKKNVTNFYFEKKNITKFIAAFICVCVYIYTFINLTIGFFNLFMWEDWWKTGWK